MNGSLLLGAALAALSGFLLIITFPKFDAVWMAPFALTPLLIAVAREPSRRWRFALGYVTGLIYWCGVNYWIEFVVDVHGVVVWAGGEPRCHRKTGIPPVGARLERHLQQSVNCGSMVSPHVGQSQEAIGGLSGLDNTAKPRGPSSLGAVGYRVR